MTPFLEIVEIGGLIAYAPDRQARCTDTSPLVSTRS